MTGPVYANGLGTFTEYKCNRCKNTFKTGSGATGYCPNCDKTAISKARYMGFYD